MATILSFTPRKPTRRPAGPELAAAIIIFPGVRYEQASAAGQESCSAPASLPLIPGGQPPAPRH